jgi:hypothetical protein
MPYRLDWKIVLAGAAMLIGGVPTLAHGGSSVGHSSVRSAGPTSTRVSPSARSITSPAPAGRMLVTTAPNVRTMTTTGPPTSAVADPPSIVTTAPLTISGAGRRSASDLSQFNPGAQDLAMPAVSAARTAVTTTTATTTGSQILGVNGLVLRNVTTSGAVAQAPTRAAIAPTAIIGPQGEVIATSGGSSRTGGGAMGRTMPECMAAWDKATHITQTRWRELCADTLTEPHI